jgi:2'-5' RNA ligase
MMLRSFLAVELPAELQQAIARSLAPLQKSLPARLIRWVPSHNVHLTLKFLGDVSPAGLEQLAGALQPEAAAHSVFPCQAGTLGAFPNPRRARVLWIGLEAPPALTALARGVEAVAARLGYLPETRPFSPHLTVGRVGQSAGVPDLQRIHTALEATPVGRLGTFSVQAVQIFKSDLQASGPVYTRLYSLPLRA